MLLLLSSFIWMSLPVNNGLDITTQKWIGAFRMIMPSAAKPRPDEIIFVDVSKSRYLLPVNSDSTENDVVVNRKYLAELFSIVHAHQNDIKYIFTDVFFDTPTADDSALAASITALGNKFLSINTYDGKGALSKNILHVRAATATVTLQESVVYKIPFLGNVGDTMVPYQMYYDLHRQPIKSNFLFTWFSGKGIAFNTQVHDYVLRSEDFNDGGYTKIGLGELVSLLKISPEVFTQYIKGRYVLIGDFENDVHSTYLNDQPGTLSLFNAYLHLKNGKQLLSIWYLLALYLFLYSFAKLHTSKKTQYHFFLKVPFFERFVIPVNIISLGITSIVFTCISSLLFGVNVSVFYLIAIFSFIEIGQFLVSKLEKKPRSV